MKSTRHKEDSASHASEVKSAFAAWSRTGVASLVATSMLFSTCIISPATAFAAPTEDGVELLTMELATLGASTNITTATSIQLSTALTAAIAETTNDPDCKPENLVTAILGSGRSDITIIAPSIVAAAIKGLQTTVGSSTAPTTLTTQRIQAILNAAAAQVAPAAFLKMATTTNLSYPTATVGTTTYTTQLTKYNASLTAVQTAVSNSLGLVAAAAIKGLPVTDPDPSVTTSNIAADAAAVVANFVNNFSFNATIPNFNGGAPVSMVLDNNQIGAVTGATIKAFPAAYQGAATTSAVTAALNAVTAKNGGTMDDATLLALSTAVLKNAPTANLQQAADVLVNNFSNKVANARALFGAVSLAPTVTAVAKTLIANAADQEAMISSLAALTTGPGNTSIPADLKVTDATRAAIAAAGVSVNPANTLEIINTVIGELKPVAPTKSPAPSSLSLQGVLTSVVGILATSDPTNIDAAVSAFVSAHGSAFTTDATKLGFAKAVLTAANTGGTTNLAAGSNQYNTQSIANVAKYLAAFNPQLGLQADQTAYVGALASAIPTNAAGIAAFIKTVATNWTLTSGGGTPSLHDYAIAVVGGSIGSNSVPGTILSPAVKAAAAVGFAQAITDDPSGTTTAQLIGDIATQFTNNTVRANLASAVISAIQTSNPAAISTVFTAVANQITPLSPLLDGDRGTFAGAIVKAAPGTAAAITTAALAGITDQTAINNITTGLIRAVPTNTSVLPDIISSAFASASGAAANEASFIKSALAASPIAADSVASALATQIKTQIDNHTIDYSTLFGTTIAGSTLTLQAQGSSTAKLAAALVSAIPGDAGKIAEGAINSSASAASVLTAIATRVTTGSVAGLVGTTADDLIAVASGTSASAKSFTTMNGAAALGGVAAGVNGAVPTVAGDVTAVLTPKIKSIANNVANANSGLVLTSTAAASSTFITRQTVQEIDLATFAGMSVKNLVDGTAINAAINGIVTTSITIPDPIPGNPDHTRTVSVLDMLNGGSFQVQTALLKPPVGGSPLITVTTHPVWTKFIAGATTQALNAAAPFVTQFLNLEHSQSGVNVSDVNSAANFIDAVLTVSAAKAADVAAGSSLFVQGSYGSTLGLSYAEQLLSVNSAATSKFTNVTLANLAKGFASADKGQAKDYAYDYAMAVPTSGKLVTPQSSNSAKVYVATQVAGIVPQDAWKVAERVSTALDSTDSGTIRNVDGRVALLNSMIPVVFTKLNKVTNLEVVGLIAARVASTLAAGSSPSQYQADIARIVANAINDKTAAAYDIFGSVAAVLNQGQTWNTNLVTAVLSALNAVAPARYIVGTPTMNTIQAQLNGALAQLGQDSTFFYTTDDLTGKETCVTNV